MSDYTLRITLETNADDKTLVETIVPGDGKLDHWLLTFRQALIEYGLVKDSTIITEAQP